MERVADGVYQVKQGVRAFGVDGDAFKRLAAGL
jgi:hypothetical protein